MRKTTYSNNYYWNILNNSGAKTVKERNDVVEKLLINNPELEEEARPQLKDKEVKGNSKTFLIGQFTNWILNGSQKNSKDNPYYSDDKKYNSSHFLKKTRKEKLEEEARIYNKSQNPEVQRYNELIRINRERVDKLKAGIKIEGTTYFKECTKQRELEKNREYIFENSIAYKDVSNTVSEGGKLNISDVEISLADPDIIEKILAFDVETLQTESMYLFECRLKIEDLLKSMDLTDVEELIIKLKVLDITYIKISERVGLTRQTVSNKYKEIINKIAVHFGKLETAKI